MKKLELSARDTCSYTLIGMPEITIDMEQRKRKERGINQMIQVNKSSKNKNRAEFIQNAPNSSLLGSSCEPVYQF